MAAQLACQRRAWTPGPEAGTYAVRGVERGLLVVSAALPCFWGLFAKTGGHSVGHEAWL